MPAYFIAHLSVRVPETFAKYAEAAQAISAEFGAKPIAFAGIPGMQDHQVIEGQPQYDGVAVVEFESEETTKRFYESPEYQAIKSLRTSSSEGWLDLRPASKCLDSRWSGRPRNDHSVHLYR